MILARRPTADFRTPRRNGRAMASFHPAVACPTHTGRPAEHGSNVSARTSAFFSAQTDKVGTGLLIIWRRTEGEPGTGIRELLVGEAWAGSLVSAWPPIETSPLSQTLEIMQVRTKRQMGHEAADGGVSRSLCVAWLAERRESRSDVCNGPAQSSSSGRRVMDGGVR
jgi:hypothetical protein